MLKTTRRGFMVGCSAAIASMAGARLNYAAFGSPEEEPTQEIVVVVFLRGGCDALSLIAPYGASADRGHYETARPTLKLPDSGANSLRQLGNNPFGLHPSAGELHDLYTNGSLGVVLAAGMNSDTRSHFDAMAYMELGTPDQRSTTTGWLTRHLSTLEGGGWPPEVVVPALSAGYTEAQSLVGSYETLAINDIKRFNLNIGPWGWHDQHARALRDLYNLGSSSLHVAGQETLDAVDTVSERVADDYVPANGAVYPDHEFGNQLKLIAQMIKMQLGLKVATVDLGGWDTHNYQVDYSNSTQGLFANLTQVLSQGLGAFYTDLNGICGQNIHQRTTVVVMSEFGRRLRENAERGCDHGHGGMMLVLGGTVNGGLYGTWPGLDGGQLYDAADLAVTTDYRRVLSEILSKRAGNNDLGYVFPGYTGYTPLGMIKEIGDTPEAVECQSVYLPVVTGP